MQLRQLEYVVAAVEEGSFTAAARRCHVAQPSLSASVASLERELGTPLFHRIGRTIRPTSTCDDLLPRARDALRAMEAAESVSRRRGEEVVGRLDLGVQPTLAATMAVSLVRLLLDRHPAVSVRLLTPADEESVADLVESGRCELGVGERSARSGLQWQRLDAEAFVLVLPPGVEATDPPLAVLGEVAVVAPPGATPTRRALDDVCAHAALRPRIVVEAEPRDALLPLVAAGVGAAVLPASSLPVNPPDGVTVVELPGRRRALGLFSRRAPLTPAADALRRLVRSSGVSVGPEGGQGSPQRR